MSWLRHLCWSVLLLVFPLPLQAHGASRHSTAPTLHPYRLLSPDPPTVVPRNWSIGDGWLASLQTPYGIRGVPSTLHLYNLHTNHWQTIPSHLLEKSVWISGGPSVSRDWVVWVQAQNSQLANDWLFCVHNIRTGQEWIIDSARAEGINPNASQAFPGAAEGALSGDILVWTTYHVDPHGIVISLLKVANLSTKHVQTLVTLPSPHLDHNVGWPATDGRYVLWDQSEKMQDHLYGYDLHTGKMLIIPQTPQASQPAVGNGYVAWKIGPRFGDSSGIAVLNLTTKQRIVIPVSNGARPSLSSCLVAYQVLREGRDGLYDFCTKKGVLLAEPQKTWANGEYFSTIHLAGDILVMSEANIKTREMQPHFALFHLSSQHPLDDFYH